MKEKYTREQIKKAISHWQRILDAMSSVNESKSQLLDLCSNTFTEDVVFSSESKFELTESNIKLLYDIFDQWFFDKKLSSITGLSLFIGDANALNKEITKYTGNSDVDLNNYLALYQPKQKWSIKSSGLLSLEILEDAIFVNIESHKYATFSYIAQALCHEMIHAYDIHFGSLLNYTVWAVNNKAPMEVIDYNSHFTRMFKEMKEKFMKDTNINILTTGNNIDFDKLCRNAAENIEQLQESDEFKELMTKPFSKEIVDYYRNSDLVHISDDGMTFSFSFGIPMPKGGK